MLTIFSVHKRLIYWKWSILCQHFVNRSSKYGYECKNICVHCPLFAIIQTFQRNSDYFQTAVWRKVWKSDQKWKFRLLYEPCIRPFLAQKLPIVWIPLLSNHLYKHHHNYSTKSPSIEIVVAGPPNLFLHSTFNNNIC